MNMGLIKISQIGSIDTQNISFYILGEQGLATIDMFTSDDKTWLITRLLVHKSMRRRGYASMLIDKAVAFCRENDLTLHCCINPYGDMSFKQLKEFYVRHGLRETETGGFLVLGNKEEQ